MGDCGKDEANRIAPTNGVARVGKVGVETGKVLFLDQIHPVPVHGLDRLENLLVGGIQIGVLETLTPMALITVLLNNGDCDSIFIQTQ